MMRPAAAFRAALALPIPLGIVLLLAACAGTPALPPEGLGSTALETHVTVDPALAERSAIELALYSGSQADLAKAELLAGAALRLAPVEIAAWRYVIVETARTVYGGSGLSFPVVEAPVGHPWAAAMTEAKAGRAPRDPSDRLADLFSIIALFRSDSRDFARVALEAIARVRAKVPDSVLVDLAEGIARERRGELVPSLAAFEAALKTDPELRPALYGKARALLALGRNDEAAGYLEGFSLALAGARDYDKLRARALYASGRLAEAEPLVAKVLSADPLDADFLIMRASMLVASGSWRQAAPLLDAFGGLRPDDRAYLLLRVRVAAEGTRNREDAERWARKALALYPDDREVALSAAGALASGSDDDLAEARLLAESVLAASPGEAKALAVLLKDAARRGDWNAAARHADALAAVDPTALDTGLAIDAYSRSGRLADAGTLAEAWLARAPGNEAATLALLRVRMERGQRSLAAELAARALAGPGSARFRSSVYYLQSLALSSDDAKLSALRSSLVEDSSNVESLGALYDFYARRNDLDKARFYLKQALAIAPLDPALARRSEDLAARGVASP